MLKMLPIMLFFTLVKSGAAYGVSNEFDKPNDLEGTTFSLLTVDRGSEIYALGGHSLLRVRNEREEIDTVFNWGIFEFKDPMFAWKFYKGVLLYKVGIWPMSVAMNVYRRVNRTVYENPLQLTLEQKARIVEKLEWWSKPENLYYEYNGWNNNCATKLRDVIDDGVSGSVKRFLPNRPEQESFREILLPHFGPATGIDTFLDLSFNGQTDRIATTWEQGFMPLRLRQQLLTLPRFDNEGRPLPGSNLLAEGSILNEGQEVPLKRSATPWAFFLFGTLPFGFVALLLRGGVKRRRLGLRILGFSYGLFHLFLGLSGILWLSVWGFSLRTELYHNANLLLAFPTDLIAGLIAIWMGVTAKRFSKVESVCGWILLRNAQVHVVLALVHLLLGQFFLEQDVTTAWFALTPGVLLGNALIWRYGCSSRTEAYAFPESHREADVDAA